MKSVMRVVFGANDASSFFNNFFLWSTQLTLFFVVLESLVCVSLSKAIDEICY